MRMVNVVPTDVVVFADAVILNHILQNLLSNAINYTKEGQIVIGAKYIDDQGGVQCWVKDTGTGISEDWLKKIFGKFETDPEKKGGQGLGLTIVKQAVEAHGGQVSVESAVGHGAKFTFTLPGKRRTK